MKKQILALSIILAVALAAGAADSKTMTRTLQAADIDTLDLDSGIGDVTISGRDGLEEVTIEVVLTPRRGGFFSSKRKAERDVEAATLAASVERDKLKLKIAADDDEDRRFEEEWIIEMPSQLRVKLEHGVGDVIIRGVVGGIEMDSGVGDVEVEAVEGDIAIDLGVGTSKVRAPAAAYGEVEAAGGVGNARITVRGEEIEGGGFVSHSASWSGDGSHRIEVSVGVGDAIVVLD
jgi:hypothetical protein